MRVTSLFVMLLFALPAASADTTYECALDPAPPCVRVVHGDTTGDGDCDAANGAGTYTNEANVWTGANPLGNSSVRVQNSCTTSESGGERWAAVLVDLYTPLSGYPTKWVGFYWGENAVHCFAPAYSGGRYGPNVYEDLGPAVCELGGPPVLPLP